MEELLSFLNLKSPGGNFGSVLCISRKGSCLSRPREFKNDGPLAITSNGKLSKPFGSGGPLTIDRGLLQKLF